MSNSIIPDRFHRLNKLLKVIPDKKDFLEKVILKNLFNIKEEEQATLVLYPTGHIDLEDIPLEVFETVEKILETKARNAEHCIAYEAGKEEDSFSEENLSSY